MFFLSAILVGKRRREEGERRDEQWNRTNELSWKERPILRCTHTVRFTRLISLLEPPSLFNLGATLISFDFLNCVSLRDTIPSSRSSHFLFSFADRPRKRERRITEREWAAENGTVGCNDVENREDWSSWSSLLLYFWTICSWPRSVSNMDRLKCFTIYHSVGHFTFFFRIACSYCHISC